MFQNFQKKKLFRKAFSFERSSCYRAQAGSFPQVPRSPGPGITDRPQRTGFANVLSLASVTFLTIRKHNLKLSKLFISSGCPDCMLVSTQRRPLSVYQLQLCLKTRTPPSYSPLKILQRIPGSELQPEVSVGADCPRCLPALAWPCWFLSDVHTGAKVCLGLRPSLSRSGCSRNTLLRSGLSPFYSPALFIGNFHSPSFCFCLFSPLQKSPCVFYLLQDSQQCSILSAR